MIVEESEPIGKSKDLYSEIVGVNHPKAARKSALTPHKTNCNKMPYLFMVDCRHPYGFYESECIPVKTNVYKDKRAWRLSHEAFLMLQELAQQQGLQTAAFLEVISRELALQRLSEEQRARIKAEAQRITAERTNGAQ